MKITYQEFQEAIKLFGLIGLETKKQVKDKYLKLSKRYHPDMSDGDEDKFQKINKSYKILEYYIDNYQFTFSKEEFKKQYPFSENQDEPWSLW